MFGVRGAEDLLCLLRQIRLPDVTDGENGQQHPFGVSKGQRFSRFQPLGDFPGNVQGDGDGPEGTIFQAHPVPDRLVVGAVHEPGERAEAPV